MAIDEDKRQHFLKKGYCDKEKLKLSLEKEVYRLQIHLNTMKRERGALEDNLSNTKRIIQASRKQNIQITNDLNQQENSIQTYSNKLGDVNSKLNNISRTINHPHSKQGVSKSNGFQESDVL